MKNTNIIITVAAVIIIVLVWMLANYKRALYKTYNSLDTLADDWNRLMDGNASRLWSSNGTFPSLPGLYLNDKQYLVPDPNRRVFFPS